MRGKWKKRSVLMFKRGETGSHTDAVTEFRLFNNSKSLVLSDEVGGTCGTNGGEEERV
jgi:hypothetical protein